MIPRYSMADMDWIWSEENQYIQWINVEIAALKALGRGGIIPDINIPFIDILHKDTHLLTIGQNPEKRIRIDIDNFIKDCKEDERTTTHDVASCVNVLERRIGIDIGKYLHYGMTGSDLVDTALALRIKESNTLIHNSLLHLQNTLHMSAHKHKDVCIMGRTHGKYAEPISLGLVFGLYVAEFGRHIERMDEITKRIYVGKMSGSVGSYVHINPGTERIFLEILRLSQPKITNQIIQRDRHAELFNLYALIGTTLEKLATQIRHYSRSEVNEMAEGHGKGYTGSSSMPHKKNPIGSENICGLARMLRGYAATALENNSLWHERDLSHSCTERFLFPDASGILYHMLSKMKNIIMTLYINTEGMTKKVEDNIDMWSSQYRMLKLIDGGASRREAHTKVQNNEDLNEDDTHYLIPGNKEPLIKYFLRHTNIILSKL